MTFKKKPYNKPEILGTFKSNIDVINDKLVDVEEELKKMHWNQRMQQEEYLRKLVHEGVTSKSEFEEEDLLSFDLETDGLQVSSQITDYVDTIDNEPTIEDLVAPFDNPGEEVPRCGNCGLTISADNPPCGFSHAFLLIQAGIKPPKQWT